MKKLSYTLSLLFILGLLTACGGSDETDAMQSAGTESITEKVGGPFTSSEFRKFLKDLPSVPGMTVESQAAMDDSSINGAILSGKVLSAVKSLGWDEDRFLYIYGQSISVMNVEQMTRIMTEMKTQMENLPEDQRQIMEQMMQSQVNGQMDTLKAKVDKLVPSSEQAIIRDNIDGLYNALGIQK